ncbi:nuclear pore complex protein Nup85 [Anabrus simplex]|uniref:nuclear pore complex protein Nup85 n=1 Tax=Anabrus simplex TaxID=316456 RepID=UPI0035A2AF5F
MRRNIFLYHVDMDASVLVEGKFGVKCWVPWSIFRFSLLCYHLTSGLNSGCLNLYYFELHLTLKLFFEEHFTLFTMDDMEIYAIPDAVCEEAGMAAAWFPGNRLGVFAFRGDSDTSKSRKALVNNVKVHQVRLSNLLFNPITRKLINDSNGTFLAAQKLAEKGASIDIRSELLKLSRQYRSFIRACLENLQDEATKLENYEKDSYLQLISIFYNVEFVWHLCEILYVDAIPGDVVLPQFLEWIRFHFFKCERQAAAFMNAGYGTSTLEERAEAQSDYWDTVIGLILQGRTDPARSLLRLHSSAHTEPFSLVDMLLQTMPVYTVYGGFSVTEFNIRWKCWQNQCITKIEAGAFASDKNLELIVKILAGDKQAFEVVKNKCETWYQYMAAVLLYTEPTVKIFDLSFHAVRCIAQFGGEDEMLTVDHILLALLESDLEQVINLISRTTENGWFAAHLTNLLYLCGSLNIVDKQQINLTKNLHERLLLDYGSLLISHRSLWQVGISYFDHCPTEGRRHLELLLPTLPLTTESKALKIIQVAEDRGLTHIACDICKVLGMRSFKQQRLGNAMSWALRSQDSAFVTYLANQFLEQYNHQGKFQSTDLLENLGSCILLSDRLTFLGKYCEFHQLYRAGAFLEAGRLLVSLLSSKLAPKSFWLILLMDALPLLEWSDIVFSSEETLELLGWLERLTRNGNPLPNTPSDSVPQSQSNADSESVFSEKVNIIRLALGRNLSRALCQEASVAEEESKDQFEGDSGSYFIGATDSHVSFSATQTPYALDH